MANTVEIANIALQMIGEQQITSFEDGTDNAREVLVRFSTARDVVLRDHPWNFAKARTRLALLNETPAFGWDFQFQLPEDLIRVLHVALGEGTFHPFAHHTGRYVIEGNKLLANEDQAFMIYVRREKNTELWDPLAVEALAARLASELAITITDDRQFAAQLRDDYREKLQRARSVDAKDEPPRRVESDSFITARFTQGGAIPLSPEFRGIEDP